MAFKIDNPTDNTDNPTKDELRDRRIAARKALDAERKRVMGIRARIDETAEAAVRTDKYTVNYGGEGPVTGAGVVPQKTYEWLKERGGSACSLYACSIMREAGVTVPNSVGPDGVTINNVTYKPGDKMPIIPGNDQFDSVAPQLGFELRPAGSTPEEGDVTRASYGYGVTSHSTIQTGDGLNVYNPGNLTYGLKQAATFADPRDFGGMTKEESQEFLEEFGHIHRDSIKERMVDGKIYPSRLMQYVGDLPALRKQYRQAAKAAPYKPVTLKPKPIQLSSPKPTAQLPTNISNFFNRNK
jgi:hypothetical protein